MQEIDMNDLVHNTSIIHTAGVQLDYYTYLGGVPVLSATLREPQGIVYFFTDDILLDLFYKGNISLQSLFARSHPATVTIRHQDKLSHHLKTAIPIELEQGGNLFHQFGNQKDPG